jgi:hypothetical protein
MRASSPTTRPRTSESTPTLLAGPCTSPASTAAGQGPLPGLRLALPVGPAQVGSLRPGRFARHVLRRPALQVGDYRSLQRLHVETAAQNATGRRVKRVIDTSDNGGEFSAKSRGEPPSPTCLSEPPSPTCLSRTARLSALLLFRAPTSRRRRCPPVLASHRALVGGRRPRHPPSQPRGPICAERTSSPIDLKRALPRVRPARSRYARFHGKKGQSLIVNEDPNAM